MDKDKVKPKQIKFIVGGEEYLWDKGDVCDIIKGRDGAYDTVAFVDHFHSDGSQRKFIDVHYLIERGYAEYVEPPSSYGQVGGLYSSNSYITMKNFRFFTLDQQEEFDDFFYAVRRIWQWCRDCEVYHPINGNEYYIVVLVGTELSFEWVGPKYYDRSPFMFATQELVKQCINELSDEWLSYFRVKK